MAYDAHEPLKQSVDWNYLILSSYELEFPPKYFHDFSLIAKYSMRFTLYRLWLKQVFFCKYFLLPISYSLADCC